MSIYRDAVSTDGLPAVIAFPAGGRPSPACHRTKSAGHRGTASGPPHHRRLSCSTYSTRLLFDYFHIHVIFSRLFLDGGRRTEGAVQRATLRRFRIKRRTKIRSDPSRVFAEWKPVYVGPVRSKIAAEISTRDVKWAFRWAFRWASWRETSGHAVYANNGRGSVGHSMVIRRWFAGRAVGQAKSVFLVIIENDKFWLLRSRFLSGDRETGSQSSLSFCVSFVDNRIDRQLQQQQQQQQLQQQQGQQQGQKQQQ